MDFGMKDVGGLIVLALQRNSPMRGKSFICIVITASG
jgi:hypothetical protein